MRTFSVVFLVYALVMSRMACGAAVDRHESDRQRNTAVFKLQDTTKEIRAEEDGGVAAAAVLAQSPQQGEEEEGEDYHDEYSDEEYDDGLSGDYEIELPRVAMSSKPKDPIAILDAERRRGKGRKKGKGKGKKRDPCLRKYKDFCIHGTCQYLRDIRMPSCVCDQDFSGERCQLITLPVEKPQEGYNRTTALAVVAVVLSSVCLIIIGLLLLLRFHKRGAYDVENEEKVKLGLASNH